MKFVRRAGRDRQPLADSPVALDVQRNFVITGRDVKAVKQAGVVVGDTRVIAVHEYLRVPRLHEDSQFASADDDAGVHKWRRIGIRVLLIRSSQP